MENVGLKLRDFYKGRDVLITGHTGFKGSWLAYELYLLGANVTGVSLAPNEEQKLFHILNINEKIDSRFIDIRNLTELEKVFQEKHPEIVIHMAAQPLVIDSYHDPVYTYDVNVMGTVNICECIRKCESVKSFINVTTDKVYQNNEWCYGYRETDRLNGHDPYSNSKSCSELVTDSYIKSFFFDRDISVSTCRAGNVIGGGDFSANRIIPDCIKFASKNEKIILRNPNSIRPYQHVLEAITFYLLLAKKQIEDKIFAGSYNIGPEESDCITTGNLASIFCNIWGGNSEWTTTNYDGPHEANFLRLDTSKAKMFFGWKPIWNVENAVEKTIEWSKALLDGCNTEEVTTKQIMEYLIKGEVEWNG